jgi:peptide/nickel transport system permease protein
MPRRSAGWIIGRGVSILLISGLAGATLVRLAPGFGIDEEALDPRLSAETIKAREAGRKGERNPLAFYGRFLVGLLRGDAGRSVVFDEPVGLLLRERAPTTVREVLAGLAFGWSIATALAILGALSRRTAPVLMGSALSGALLSIPSAVLATICLLLRISPAIAIAAVVMPRVFPHIYEQIRASLAAPHVVMARARGLRQFRLFVFHIAPAALVPLVALAGVSVTLAFGASIPIEALADSPGIGQLAWKAALGRDLPVLVSITLLLTAITVCASAASDLVLMRLGRQAA